MKRRARIGLALYVDLDQVEGQFHDYRDFVKFLQNELKRVSHYNPNLFAIECSEWLDDDPTSV